MINQMGGYLQVTVIIGIILQMILRVWAYSGLVLVFCFLLYYMYGGFFAFILLFVSILGMLYHAQDNFLFYPEIPSHSRVYVPIPSMFALPYESVYTKALDGAIIHMYFVCQPRERRKNSPTILFFHGNAGNMGHRLQNCAGLFHNLRCNILLVEYRGYGLSEGNATEEGLYLDAKASLEYLLSRNDINHAEIIVFGRSLGGAVAIDLVSRDEYCMKVWCLLVENTFTSIPDMARIIFGWRIFHLLPLFCYKNKTVVIHAHDGSIILLVSSSGQILRITFSDSAKQISFSIIFFVLATGYMFKIRFHLSFLKLFGHEFLSCNKVKLLSVPSLFISGLSDTLVPPRMMTELHSSCSSYTKQLLQVPTGTHNETWTLQGYYHSLAMFLQSCRIHNVKIYNKDTQLTISDKKKDRIEIL